ncbi:MAG: DUF4870 domain-containing protein [Clostridiales bacterium]|nr:DUF4870 domain-containing protein [Clostridiales bacterium]
MNKSIFNLDENLAAALSYVFSIVSGIIVLVLEKENKFVRFHAMQSVLLGVAVAILNIVLGILSGIPIIGFIPGLVHWAFGLVTLALTILLIIKALGNETYKLPVLGEVAQTQVNK